MTYQDKLIQALSNNKVDANKMSDAVLRAFLSVLEMHGLYHKYTAGISPWRSGTYHYILYQDGYLIKVGALHKAPEIAPEDVLKEENE